LRRYNEWRRGAATGQPDPKQLGEDIDAAILLLEGMMDFETYEKELKQLYIFYRRKKRELFERCALANNQVRVGDIVTDHVGSVMVEKIQPCGQVSSGSTEPSCLYRGGEYTKKGKPFKSGSKRDVYQSNVVAINNKVV
jgi:hypothetical protein